MSKSTIDINEEELYRKIFDGIINPFDLPVNLYEATAASLSHGVEIGFGATSSIAEKFMIGQLRENIFMFSGAKTFQQTLEMSEKLLENGKPISFKKFKEKAKELFDTYNKNYLKTEYDTAILQAQNASRWIDIQSEKKIFSLLKYDATLDSHLCPICKPLDGIVKPVNDPFWKRFYPMNHFNCRCNVRQLESWEESVTKNTKTTESEVSSKMDKTFLFNPGAEASVFLSTGKDKHPYFSVPKKYAKFAEKNFNLKIPKKK